MGASKIEWTEATWNPVRGCTRVSAGCGGPGPHGGCYAEAVAARFSKEGLPYHGIAEIRDGKPRWTGKLAFVESKLTEPLKVKKPTTWFVNSMSDLFHEKVEDAWIDKIFAVMATCPQHTFQVLTKRPARMRAYLNALVCDDGRRPFVRRPGWSAPDQRDGDSVFLLDEGQTWPLANVWLGTSCEDQATADARIPDLLATAAAVRFASAEPLLGPIDFEAAWHGESALESECWGDCAWCEKGYPPLHNCKLGKGDWERGRSGLDWVIVGGESGPQARPMHPAWARTIRDQCAAAGVPFFFKQWGEWKPSPDHWDGLQVAVGTGRPDIAWPDGTIEWGSAAEHGGPGRSLCRVGKRRAGRLLDGVEHNGMPPTVGPS